MIDKPLYGNLLAGGAMTRPEDNQLQGDALVKQMQMRMTQRDKKTPAFMKYAGDVFETQGYPTKTMQEYENLFPSTNQRQPVSLLEAGSNANFNVSPPGTLIPIDPIMQGFQESEFRKKANNMQQDAVYFKYKGKDMQMNSSMAGAFKNYLDSIGKGDLYESELSNAGPLQQVGINDQLNPLNPVSGYQQATPPLLDGTKGFPVTVSGPETIASVNPFEEQFTGFQNQLTDFGDQFSTLGDRLTKVEEGIASLLNKNTGSSFNSMQPTFGYSRYGYSPFSMVGLGSLFGGYYG